MRRDLLQGGLTRRGAGELGQVGGQWVARLDLAARDGVGQELAAEGLGDRADLHGGGGRVLLAGGGGADAGVAGALGGDDGDVDALGPVVIGQEADDLLGQVLVARDGGGVGLRRVRPDGEDRQGQAGRQDRAGPAGQEAARLGGRRGSDLLRRRSGTVEGRGIRAHGTRLSERDRPHDPATWSVAVGPARRNNPAFEQVSCVGRSVTVGGMEVAG